MFDVHLVSVHPVCRRPLTHQEGVNDANKLISHCLSLCPALYQERASRTLPESKGGRCHSSDLSSYDAALCKPVNRLNLITTRRHIAREFCRRGCGKGFDRARACSCL